MEDFFPATAKGPAPGSAHYHLDPSLDRAADWWKPGRTGISMRTLFKEGEEGAGYRVALVRYAPGAGLPERVNVHDEHAYVLEGDVNDGRGSYGPGTYLYNPSGSRHILRSEGGCLMILHRPVPDVPESGRSASPSADGGFLRIATGAPPASAAWKPLRPGVDILGLYEGPPGDYAAAMLRYRAGASVPAHLHQGDEHIYVVSGSQRDERGSYGPGSYVYNPAGTAHRVASEEGCTILIHWRAPVRFVQDPITS
jgi:anti-sigma factor ChrR (cupin superfamily)